MPQMPDKHRPPASPSTPSESGSRRAHHSPSRNQPQPQPQQHSPHQQTTPSSHRNNQPVLATRRPRLAELSGAPTSSEPQPTTSSMQPAHDPSRRLSKLTLSASLHQLSDSKFVNTNSPLLTSKLCHSLTSATIHESDPMVAQPGPSGATPLSTNNQPQTTPAKRKSDANVDTVHVVVGNEACDLDSAVSSLLMFHIISKIANEINGKDKPQKTLYLPLLNTTRELLDSKPEVVWFLQKTLSIDKTFLTCKDDIDWAEIKKSGAEVLVTLVDHNYNEEFNKIGRVVEIIDHHQIQNSQWLMENQSKLKLTIDTSVGSCTTLVAERLFYIYAEHHVADEILLLIYGTVLLDTICLSERAKRFTRRDVYLLKKMDALLGAKKPNRAQLYRQLVEVKACTGELDFEKLMNRDLKVYKDKHGIQVAIASLFGMAAKDALGLAVNLDLEQFFRENKYEAFIIMGLVADPEHSDSLSRDLVLLSTSELLFENLCTALESKTSNLDLVPVWSNAVRDPEDTMTEDHHERLAQLVTSIDSNNQQIIKLRIWTQENVVSSRKVVAPIVLKVLQDQV